MEAQRLLSGFCSTSPIQSTKTQFLVKSPFLSCHSCPVYSLSQSHKWVSFKTYPFISQKLSRKVMQCWNRSERTEVIASHKEDLTNGLRRKKLAVFVSSGGSNFRSIHEACLGGSIHGDIVALVTSKQVFSTLSFGGKGNYGMKVHKGVIASGARCTGPTIHFVDEHYDTGRIHAQRVVPALVKDTAEELATRVLEKEHRLYVEVITALCE